MPELRVATVLFTDLVGSTELSTDLGPPLAEALVQTHFSLLRTAVAEHGGVEVKGVGDGLMVAFSTPSGALACAAAMQQALDRHNRSAPHPLSMRVGLSHGEVAEEKGDLYGDAVVEAARLCAQATGGQILATQIVQLASGRRATQEFEARGELVLKGFDTPVSVVEVVWAPLVEADSASPIPLPGRCTAAPDAGFVGRVPETSVLSDAFKSASVDARRRVVLLGGEPGMGKTSLAAAFARAAHEAGAIVLYGRSDEDLGVPYQPWIEAVGHLATHAPPEVLSVLSEHSRSLVQLAPDLAGVLESSASATVDPEAARFMLFSAVLSALRAAGDVAPVVLVLDDLQWADAASLQLLRHIATTTEPMRVLVVATFRESDVEAASQLAQVLAACHREQGMERISLRGLNDTELLALMESAAGQAMDQDGLALRDALLTETDGNPFFVGELLRHLVEAGSVYRDEGRWIASGDLREHGLPVSVREVIGRRTARLGDEGTRVLSIAAVIGRDFDLSLLAEAAVMDVSALLDLLDAAVDAVLVVNVAGERYSFVHALIEHTLYESLSPARRAYLHGLVAEAMEAQDRTKDEPRVAELAYHWAEATVPENRDKALDYACRAGNMALAKLAPQEAARWFERALEELEHRRHPEGDQLRCRVLVGLGDAQRQAGNQAFGRTLLEAARLAQQLGATDLLVRAALANNRGFFSAIGVVDAERVMVLEHACAAVAGTGSAGEARLLALLACELTYGGDFPRRAELARRALAIARGLDEPATFVQVVCDASQALIVPETLDERLALIAEAFGLARELGDPVLTFWSGIYASLFRRQRPDLVADSDEAADVARAVAVRLGQPTLLWVSAFGDACRAMLAGDVEAVEQWAERALAIANDMDEPDGVLIYGSQLMIARQMQGRAGEVVDLVRQVAETNPGIPAYWTALAVMRRDAGDLEGARAALSHVETDGRVDFPHDLVWLIAMQNAADAAAWLHRREVAEDVFSALQPFADQVPYVGVNCSTQVSLGLAQLAAVLGRDDEADRYFALAQAAHEAMGAHWFLALTNVAWGEFLIRRGGEADRARAGELLESARVEAAARGYGLVLRQATAALAELTG
jgi:class 3 adenylate cyclase